MISEVTHVDVLSRTYTLRQQTYVLDPEMKFTERMSEWPPDWLDLVGDGVQSREKVKSEVERVLLIGPDLKLGNFVNSKLQEEGLGEEEKVD